MGVATGCPPSLVLGLCQLKVSPRMWNVFLVESCQILESSLPVSVKTFYESPSPWQIHQIQPSHSHPCTQDCQHQTVRPHCFLLVLRKTWKRKRLIATNTGCFIWVPGFEQDLQWGAKWDRKAGSEENMAVLFVCRLMTAFS